MHGNIYLLTRKTHCKSILTAPRIGLGTQTQSEGAFFLLLSYVEAGQPGLGGRPAADGGGSGGRGGLRGGDVPGGAALTLVNRISMSGLKFGHHARFSVTYPLFNFGDDQHRSHNLDAGANSQLSNTALPDRRPKLRISEAHIKTTSRDATRSSSPSVMSAFLLWNSTLAPSITSFSSKSLLDFFLALITARLRRLIRYYQIDASSLCR